LLSLTLFLALQSTDFGVRQIGHSPPPQTRSTKSIKAAVGQRFKCRVASITDGDTLRCADGTRVRIAGIDAPETSDCRSGRQCVAGDAQASKRSLAALAGGQMLTCEPVGTSYNRVVAFCSAGGVDLSCAQVRAGQAVRRYQEQERVCR
jgi:endonuclease YncB( thermonuclease family)